MGAGDQTDRNPGTLLRHNRPEGFPKTDPDHAWLVEMQRICGGDPLAGFIEHENARVRFFIRRSDLAPSGHIGLPDEEEEVKIFLIRKFRRPSQGNSLNKKETKD